MHQRMNLMEKGGAAFAAMLGLNKALEQTTLEKSLRHLVLFRVSQINGCAYCLDMHSKDFRADGGAEQKLYLASAWRESASFYSERERAALLWAESLTRLSDGENVSDAVYETVKQRFDEQEMIDLTLLIVAINGWNRFNIAFRAEPGGYQPGQWERERQQAA